MSTYKQPDQSEAERRKRSKEVYDAAIRCVDLNSGHRQPPLARQTAVIGSLHSAGYGAFGLEELHRAITAARRNGDLFAADGAEGYTWLGIDDRSRLREKIETNLSRVDSPRTDVIGLANQRVQYLRKQAEDTHE